MLIAAADQPKSVSWPGLFFEERPSRKNHLEGCTKKPRWIQGFWGRQGLGQHLCVGAGAIRAAFPDWFAGDRDTGKANMAYVRGSDDNVEIEQYPLASPGYGGTWVAAWVWVPSGRP